MFLFKKHLDRRTFLRGMGATVALPLLDAMIPARALLASMQPAQRLAFVYFPHGAVMSEWISVPTADYRQATTGSVQLGRILEPLSQFANRLTIVNEVENRLAYGPVHAITPGTWLSGTSPLAKGAATNGATADQIAAEYLGRDMLLPSISLAAEEPRKIQAGIWEGQFDPSYGQTISFRQGRIPVAMESRPRAVFDALFGSDDEADRREPSVVDRVADDTKQLRKWLGPSDRKALNEYLEEVRHAERRVESLETLGAGGAGQEDIERAFVARQALMFDLTALAFRADITRVASLMMAAETSAMTYSHVDAPESFHALSHHQNDPERIEQLVRIQTFHTRMLTAFVQNLARHRDPDGSLLDHTQIVYGSNMSDSQRHEHYPLPTVVLGPESLLLSPRAPGSNHTPMSHVLLTVLRRAGVPIESIGDGVT